MDKIAEIVASTEETGITSDYKLTQQITGLIATGGIVFTGIDILFSTIDPGKSNIIWTTLAGLASFTFLFYLIPAIYMKKWFAFLPDIVYSTGIFVLMINLGEAKGGMLITLLLLFITISAFTKPNWMFVLSVFETLTALVLFYSITAGSNQDMSLTSIIFQLLGIVTLISLLRIFARETIVLRGEQKKLSSAAYQLENQRNEILTLINNITDGLISVDINQKINIFNAPAAKMLGGDIDGKIISDIMPVTSRDAKLSLAEEVLTSGKPKFYDDLRLVTPGGMYRIYASTTPIMDENGHLMGAIISFRDVTAEKSLEEQRSEFNSIASHELRTPLSIIDGYMYNLMLDKKLKYDKKTKGYLDNIDKAVKTLITLTNDILTVTKSDNNQIEVVFEKVDVKNIIKEIVENLRPKADEKQIKLNLDIDEELPEALTDVGKFSEVLSNLVENAIKFTEEGSVKVSASENKKGIILVEVADTGEGVKEADQKRIFNRFYRVNDFRTQKAGGTGLGLYISRTFVTAMGGEIGVRSEKGKGSTFWFKIPVTVKKEENKEKSQEQLETFLLNI